MLIFTIIFFLYYQFLFSFSSNNFITNQTLTCFMEWSFIFVVSHLSFSTLKYIFPFLNYNYICAISSNNHQLVISVFTLSLNYIHFLKFFISSSSLFIYLITKFNIVITLNFNLFNEQ